MTLQANFIGGINPNTIVHKELLNDKLEALKQSMEAELDTMDKVVDSSIEGVKENLKEEIAATKLEFGEIIKTLTELIQVQQISISNLNQTVEDLDEALTLHVDHLITIKEKYNAHTHNTYSTIPGTQEPFPKMF